MTGLEHHDPYQEIAVLAPQEFELRASNLAVPLHFKPDAAFILRTVLQQEEEFTREVFIRDRAFKEVCEGTSVLSRFPSVFSDLRFTFDALGSRLIQTSYQKGVTNVYVRNPEYTVTDEHGLLVLAK